MVGTGRKVGALGRRHDSCHGLARPQSLQGSTTVRCMAPCALNKYPCSRYRLLCVLCWHCSCIKRLPESNDNVVDNNSLCWVCPHGSANDCRLFPREARRVRVWNQLRPPHRPKGESQVV